MSTLPVTPGKRLLSFAAIGASTVLSLTACSSSGTGTTAPGALGSSSGPSSQSTSSAPASSAALGSSTSSGASSTSAGMSSSMTGSSMTTSAMTGSSSAGTVAVTGGQTTLQLAPTAAAAFSTLGLSVSAAGPATGSGTSFTFPVTGGQLGSPINGTLPSSGQIDHSGGLTIAAAGKSVTLDNFVVDLSSGTLTGEIAGHRIPLFALDTSGVQVSGGSGGTTTVSGIGATIGSQLAKKMVDSLQLPSAASTQLPSLQLGTLSVTLSTGS